MSNPLGPSGLSRKLRFGADLHISAAGMVLQRRRMKVISENIANAQSRSSSPDKDPYRRKMIQVENKKDPFLGISTVRIKAVITDQSDFPRVYKPNEPGADANGMVKQANVQSYIEMGDMQDANVAHSANLKAYENTRNMLLKSMSLLDN